LAEVKIPGIEEWIKNVGYEGEISGESTLYNPLGILFVIGLLRNDPFAAISVIVVLAMGDGLEPHFPAPVMEDTSCPGIRTKPGRA
jgi:hypothetical protein